MIHFSEPDPAGSPRRFRRFWFFDPAGFCAGFQFFKNEVPIAPVKPALREIAGKLGINILNSNGNPFNTRQLGTLVIKMVKQ
jgi:hypothetical protein